MEPGAGGADGADAIASRHETTATDLRLDRLVAGLRAQFERSTHFEGDVDLGRAVTRRAVAWAGAESARVAEGHRAAAVAGEHLF